MWNVVVAFLLILCGILALICVPRLIGKYIAWLLTGPAACGRDTKWMRFGIVVSLAVVVAGSIDMVRLMLPQIARLRLYEMNHPSTIGHGVKILADKALLVMFVAPSALLYVKGGSISKFPWKWPLLVIIVLGPVGIDLIFPGYFMLTMLLLGVVWLISGEATLYFFLQQLNKPSRSGQ